MDKSKDVLFYGKKVAELLDGTEPAVYTSAIKIAEELLYHNYLSAPKEDWINSPRIVNIPSNPEKTKG